MGKNGANKVVIPGDIKPYPRPHELKTAYTLAKAGFVVEFLRPDNRPGAKTADILLDGVHFEMKAPVGGAKSIERNLKRGTRQSSMIVFDSRRMRITNSIVIEREVYKKYLTQRAIVSIIFIDRHGRVIEFRSKE